MATVFRGDPASDLRNVLAWLQRLDFTSTAAQPPVERRSSDAADTAQAQHPADADGNLKSAMEKSAAERRANLRTPDDKPEQSAVQEAARVNQRLEKEREPSQVAGREREAAQAAGRDTAATSGGAGASRSTADETPEQRLARAIDAPGALGNRDAPGALSNRDAAPGALANRPAVREPENTAVTAKLIERASGLLRLGDIGGARLVLAIASENGSARAAFMLAETYDPRVLSTWNAMGTSADLGKAREFYAKAYAGGIVEAKARSEALPK